MLPVTVNILQRHRLSEAHSRSCATTLPRTSSDGSTQSLFALPQIRKTPLKSAQEKKNKQIKKTHKSRLLAFICINSKNDSWNDTHSQLRDVHFATQPGEALIRGKRYRLVDARTVGRFLDAPWKPEESLKDLTRAL